MNINLRIPPLPAVLSHPQRDKDISSTKQRGQSAIAETFSRLLWPRGRASRAEPPTYHHLPPDPFPVELWVQIIKSCSSHSLREWVALSRTCWFFHQISQPCLYEKLILWKFRERPDAKGSLGRSLSLFERSLRKRPELGVFVRELTLHVDVKFSIPEPSERRRRRPPYSFLYNLNQLPNLQRLRAHDIHIDAELCHSLHSRPFLNIVELMHCSLDNHSFLPARNEPCDASPIYTDHFPDSRISEINLVSADDCRGVDEGLWAAFAPGKLRSLTLSAACPDPDNSALGLMLSSMMASGKNKMLERLSINFFRSSMVQFLTSSPQLRHLTINCPRNDPPKFSILSSLPADAIPLLEHYSGPADISNTLLRNRPVHSVSLVFERETELPDNAYVNVLASLQLSSVPVTELTLWNVTLGDWLRHVPTTICHLEIHNLDMEVFIKWLPALSHLTNLNTIYGALDGWEEKYLRREDIIQIFEALPSLREFDISHQRWVMVKPGVWECFRREYH